MTQESRRKVLKGLAITLPAAWATPVVESVILPVHAGTSPSCLIYVAEGVDPDSSEDDLITICAVVCGDRAEVTHTPIFNPRANGQPGPVVYVQRMGTLRTDGTQGDMVVTSFGPNCSPQDPNGVGQVSVPATITNVSDDSLTYTLIRPKGNLVVTLDRTDSCPSVPAATGDCDDF